MRLFLSLKHSCENSNINDNIKFVIQIKTHFVKINNKAKINIFEKTIFYRLIDQFSKISLIFRDDDKDIQFDIIFHFTYLTLKYTL